jgi:hypothetical protein
MAMVWPLFGFVAGKSSFAGFLFLAAQFITAAMA